MVGELLVVTEPNALASIELDQKHRVDERQEFILTPFQSKAPVSAGRCLVEEAVPN
jgi:hypothetical protein